MSRQDVKGEAVEEAAEEMNPTDAEETVGGAANDAASEAADTAAEEDAEVSADTEAGETADANAAGGQEDDAEDTAKSGSNDAGEKNGFFNRKKKKDKKDEQIEELTDRLKRTMAEFENFRKRNEREKSQMYEIGARDMIEKMLPVMDNFERGLASVPEDQKDNAVAQGMEMIYKQMQTTFDQIGVKAIEAVGREFDPNFHNAVMHEDNDQVGENIIVEEFQKGYTYRDTVIRHSMVKVAN